MLDETGGSNANLRPWENYASYIQKRAGVTSLGVDIFGDSVNLYNGALSFSVTDISVPGNSGLPVALTRTMSVSHRPDFFIYDRPMADWDLDLPRISGVYGTTWANNRCSATGGPGSVSVGATVYPPDDYWQGLHANIAAGGELLVADAATPKPAPGTGTFRWLTPGMTYIDCLASIQNGSGEGFIALAPDGTRYWFDWMAQYYEAPLASPTADTPNPQELARRVNVLYATRVEDRFGHWVTYTYTNASNAPARLASIQASDGRSITLTYNPNGKVASATSHGRVWNFEYNAAGTSLTAVVLPDTRRWQIDFKPLSEARVDFSVGDPRSCDTPSAVATDSVSIGTVDHPSGASADFEVRWKRSGRSNVPKACANWEFPNNSPQNDVAIFVRDYDGVPLVRKRVTGVALPAMEWIYTYGATRSWAAGTGPVCTTPNCADAVCKSDSCAGTSVTTVSGPNGEWQRYTFGNSYRYNEGKLRLVERGGGPTNILHSEATTYELGETDLPFASPMGTSLRARGDGFAVAYPRPRKSTVITRPGATFTNTVTAFDNYARATQVTQSSSLGYSRTQTTSYHDNTALWVIGQTASVTVDGKVAELTTFDPATALPTTTSAFGKQQQRLTYHTSPTQAGLVNEIFDAGNVQKTTLSDYHRGLPRSVVFHDATAITATVNDRGDITSVTDALGYKTCYAYDALSRLERITQPSETVTGVCNASAWAETVITFAPQTEERFGMPVGHWLRTETTGARVSETLYDGLWRPLLSRTATTDASAAPRFVRRAFDHAGRETLASYPVDAVTNYIGVTAGVKTTYDTIGRVIRTEADSELGVLTTTTEYLPGFQTRVTNPRNHSTTTTFQAFDQPATDSPMQVTAPEGVTTTFQRDVFGKPTSLTRSGVYQGAPISATRTYVYDSNERLCKTIEPESGATVVDYNAANQIAWRTMGSSLTGPTCDRGNVPTNQRSIYAYDPLNRLLGIDHPAGTDDVGFTYHPDGALATASTQGSVWTYGYNRRRLPTTESLAFDGQTFGLSRGYDALGSVSSLTYPGGFSVAFNPNALGEPRQVGTFASQVAYHPNGSLSGFRYGNDVVHSTTQNDRKLPLRARAALGATSLVDFTVAYDGNANPTQITDGVAGAIETKALGYDGLDRLTTASAAGTFLDAVIDYDPLDNIRRYAVNGRDWRYVIDAATQRLTRINNPAGTQQVAYTYDSRGNLATRDDQGISLSFTVDRAQRLIDNRFMGSVQKSFRYDAHGRRTEVAPAGGDKRYTVYSRDGQLLHEAFRPSGSTVTTRTTDYLYLGGTLIAKRTVEDVVPIAVLFKDGFEPPSLASPPSSQAANTPQGTAPSEPNAPAVITTTVTYLHTDPLGSPVAETNATGQVLRRSRHEPYGYPLIAPPDGQPGYTGHIYDTDTEFNYAQQRYLDPKSGRFIAVDPVAAGVGNFNRYAYAANNPYRNYDPDGRNCTGTRMLDCGSNSASVRQHIDYVRAERGQSRGGRGAPVSREQMIGRQIGSADPADYDSEDPLFHEYRFASRLCAESASCTVALLAPIVNPDSAPRFGSVTEGLNVLHLGNPIYHASYFDESGAYLMVNVTDSAHDFHAGAVVSRLYSAGGQVNLETHGFGYSEDATALIFNYAVGYGYFSAWHIQSTSAAKIHSGQLNAPK